MEIGRGGRGVTYVHILPHVGNILCYQPGTVHWRYAAVAATPMTGMMESCGLVESVGCCALIQIRCGRPAGVAMNSL